MFDPKAIAIAQMRYEEERHNVQYERLIQWQPRRPSLRDRALAGIGRLLVRWGSALERRYDRVNQQTSHFNAYGRRNGLGRAL